MRTCSYHKMRTCSHLKTLNMSSIASFMADWVTSQIKALHRVWHVTYECVVSHMKFCAYFIWSTIILCWLHMKFCAYFIWSRDTSHMNVSCLIWGTHIPWVLLIWSSVCTSYEARIFCAYLIWSTHRILSQDAWSTHILCVLHVKFCAYLVLSTNILCGLHMKLCAYLVPHMSFCAYLIWSQNILCVFHMKHEYSVWTSCEVLVPRTSYEFFACKNTNILGVPHMKFCAYLIWGTHRIFSLYNTRKMSCLVWMSHIWMSHVSYKWRDMTRLIHTRHDSFIWMSHVSYEWVVSHMDESCLVW